MTEVILNDNIAPSSNEYLDGYRVRITQKHTRGKVVRDIPPKADAYHLNYLQYLCECWACHMGAIIDPVYFWQMILCELATTIKNSPEAYQSHFTDSNEKKDIIIPGDTIQIDTNHLCRELRKHIKEDIDTFLPAFSTHTTTSELAHSAAFCDAVSPYCGHGTGLDTVQNQPGKTQNHIPNQNRLAG